MSKIISRIKQFIDSQDISNRELERTIGASEGMMSKAFRNNTEIRTDSIEYFVESYPQVSAEWLLRGEGEMIKQNVRSESELITQLLDRITDLARENGQLRELLKKGGSAESAGFSSVASVG